MASSMDDHYYSSSKSSNKITEIVRLQQMIKKWKKLAVAPKTTTTTTKKTSVGGFLKRTLSFTDASSAASASPPPAGSVPKGYLAVCVGEELRRYVMPTEYLSHRAFVALLQEAEEEFGFQQEGVLRIPCDVGVFEGVMRKVVEDDQKMRNKVKDGGVNGNYYYCSAEADHNDMISSSAARQYSQKPICR